MGSMVDEITRRVLAALASKKPDAPPVHAPASAPAIAPPAAPLQPQPAPPEPAKPHMDTVRRVSPIRLRSSSILGLDVGPHDPES
jgi:hypothetical protein